MRINGSGTTLRHLWWPVLDLSVGLSLMLPAVFAQARPPIPYYARANSFGVFVGYSNNSSHILLGDAEHRKLLLIGASYNRRLLLRRIGNWQYSVEILPVAVESDPLSLYVDNQTSPTQTTYVSPGPPVVSCAAQTFNYTFTGPDGETYSGTESSFCHGRQWTFGEAISPVGVQWNFLPRRKLQPFFVGHGGYMFSTQPIPIPHAGSFNFTFDFGAGFELYRSRTRSIRLEYRYHHISNDNTATYNPGIDNGLVQVTYCFGR